MHTPAYDCHCAILEIHDGRLYLPAMNLKYPTAMTINFIKQLFVKISHWHGKHNICVMQSFERALVSQFSYKTTEQQEDLNHNRCSLDYPQNYTPRLVTAELWYMAHQSAVLCPSHPPQPCSLFVREVRAVGKVHGHDFSLLAVQTQAIIKIN